MKMMVNAYGNLDNAIVTGIDRANEEDVMITAEKDGVICYICDLYNRTKALSIGQTISLEEVTVLIYNGRLLYMVPDDLRGVTFED